MVRPTSKLRQVFLALAMVAITTVGCSSRFTSEKRGVETLPEASSTASVIQPTGGLVQNTDAAVTIGARWIKAENNALVFEVAMDTHSVDLDRYDLGKLSVLRDDAANEYRPVSWDAPPGGHHRSGTLVFPLPDSLVKGNTRYFEMVIRDVAGVKERVLKWEL